MKAWLAGLNSREQYILIFGGGTLLLMLLYSLLWEPLSDDTARLSKVVQEQRATLAWMQQAAKQVISTGPGGATLGQRKESLLTLVDRSAKSAALGGTIKRIQPDKDGSVRIWLEDVKFDQMIRWLALLSRDHGVILDNSNIEKQEVPALVNARLTLKGNA